MRHLMTSFLALHWAVVFALLAYVCIDGTRGLEVVLSMLGASPDDASLSRFGGTMIIAPLATAFLTVAVLFCWAFVEVFVGDAEQRDGGDGVVRIAFIAAGGILLLVLVGGAAQGIKGLSMAVSVHLGALMISYLAILGERWTAVLGSLVVGEARITARAMARSAAHNSLLARISGRPDAGRNA